MMPMTSRMSAVGNNQYLSLTKQTELLGVPCGRCYYRPIPESDLNLKIMRLMDELYLDQPYKGLRRMLSWLARVHEIEVNIKRLNRLYYKVMGLQSVLPGPHTSRPTPGNKTFPYLLRGLTIDQPNQVWQTDISYIPMSGGYLYLTVWIDVFSRFVLNWSLSNTMTAEWCAEVYEQTSEKWGSPRIVNTDQGSQYTSAIFTGTVLNNSSVQLSMDGRGRATDNAFIERLWRTVKYEYIYLHDFSDGGTLNRGLHAYFDYYNWARDHSFLGPGLPHQFYPTGLNLCHKLSRIGVHFIPLDHEPIINEDGALKNDCERNAIHRLLDNFQSAYSQLDTIFVLDALYACAPVVERLNAVKNWRYVVTAKEAGSQHLFAQFDQRNEAGNVKWLDEQDEQGRRWEIGYTNGLELNASSAHLKVNLVFARSTDARGKEIVYSYLTNIKLTKKNIGRILSIGRSRWKIENETFNTLKN